MRPVDCVSLNPAVAVWAMMEVRLREPCPEVSVTIPEPITDMPDATDSVTAPEYPKLRLPYWSCAWTYIVMGTFTVVAEMGSRTSATTEPKSGVSDE